jgi:hypothetical protein
MIFVINPPARIIGLFPSGYRLGSCKAQIRLRKGMGADVTFLSGE